MCINVLIVRSDIKEVHIIICKIRRKTTDLNLHKKPLYFSTTFFVPSISLS